MNEAAQRTKFNRPVKAVNARDALLRKRRKPAKKQIELAYLKLAAVVKREYPGKYYRAKRKPRSVAGLETPPVESAETAARVQIVKDFKRKK